MYNLFLIKFWKTRNFWNKIGFFEILSDILDHHCICFLNISSKFYKTKVLSCKISIIHSLFWVLLRSSGNTDTHRQTDYYNPPPTLGLNIILSCIVWINSNLIRLLNTRLIIIVPPGAVIIPPRVPYHTRIKTWLQEF